LLLVNSTKSFARRMLPDAAWLRFASALAQQPIQVAERGQASLSNWRGSWQAGVTSDEWLEAMQKTSGSWWPDHLAWLTERSGDEVAAPSALGGPGYEPLAPAPGTYVHES
jgi:poly(3-hydroxyalkanoate) synthetase